MRSSKSNSGNPHSKPARKPRTFSVSLVAGIALFFTCSLSFAESDIVRLIPPDSPVLAGMRQTLKGQSNDVLWLATKNNSGDLSQLVALTANDATRRFDRVIVADSASDSDSLGNHLLLAQGRFNFDSISSAAIADGAAKTTYKGVPVVVVKSPAKASPGVRWLAVPRHDIALLGSLSAVQQALDRYLSHAPADAQILQRIGSIPEGDAAWSSVMLDSRAVESHLNLHRDAGALSCLRHARELVLGLQLGSTVTVNMRTDSDSTGNADTTMACLSNAFYGSSASPLRVMHSDGQQSALLVSLSRGEYDRWLNAFRRSMTDQMLEAVVRSPQDQIAGR